MRNKEKYEDLSAAVVSQDFDKVRSYVSEDFVLIEPASLPYGGEFRGPEGFVDLTRQIRALFSVEVVSSKFTEAEDDLLVLEYVFAFTSLRTGERAETGCVDLMRFGEDGKLLRGDIYYENPAALAAIA